MPDLAEGAVFAGHRIEGVAGKGGMGVVYRATHIALDHVVALKVISPALAQDERFRRRFGEESRIAVSIRHPNVVPIHHAGEEDGLLFVTMDLIDGSDLRGLLRERGSLEPEHAAAIVAEVASALDAAHERGLVHRDIKPGNILIERTATERVFLTDFGLARQVEASTGVTATGAFVGTLDYVAPEQIKGDRVDARSDVYALGCVLFELLTGNPPFATREDKVAKMYAHLQEEPPSLRVLRPDLPGELDGVIKRALAKDPGERYPSAGDFARAVSAAVEGETTVEAERSVATGAAAPLAIAGPRTEEAPPEPPLVETETVTKPTVHAPTDEIVERIETAEDPVRRAPPPVPPRREMRGILLAALGAVAIAAVALILLTGGGDGSSPDQQAGQQTSGEGGGGGGESPTAAPKTEGDPIPVGDLPVGIAHGEGGVWTANRLGGDVSFVDTSEFTSDDSFPTGAGPEGVAAAAGFVWVANGDAGTVSRIDPEDPSQVTEITVNGSPGGVAVGKGAVWVADAGGTTVSRIDLDDASQIEPIEVGAAPYGIAVGAESVWVTNRESDSVSRINPTERTAFEPITVGDNPKGIAISDEAVWVANTGEDNVSRIDLKTLQQEPVDVGSEPRGVVAAFGAIWVTVGLDDQVARIDPETLEVTKIDVGAGPEGITAGPNFVWVADGAADTVTRIDPDPSDCRPGAETARSPRPQGVKCISTGHRPRGAQNETIA